MARPLLLVKEQELGSRCADMPDEAAVWLAVSLLSGERELEAATYGDFTITVSQDTMGVEMFTALRNASAAHLMR